MRNNDGQNQTRIVHLREQKQDTDIYNSVSYCHLTIILESLTTCKTTNFFGESSGISDQAYGPTNGRKDGPNGGWWVDFALLVSIDVHTYYTRRPGTVIQYRKLSKHFPGPDRAQFLVIFQNIHFPI